MKTLALTLVLSAMLTVDQQDRNSSALDRPTVAVSADGRYVAFVTYAPLAAADTDQSADIYVLDRRTSQVTFESADTAGTYCLDPDISADGRHVVYESGGAIVWRDRHDDITRIVTMGRQPSISADGGTVVFTSDLDVHSVGVSSGTLGRVSVHATRPDGARMANASPSASADGRYVSFSGRPRLAGNRRPLSEIFVRDTHMRVTRRIGTGWTPSISGDGRYVAFVDGRNGVNHVLLSDLHTQTSRIITRSPNGRPGNGASANPSVSSDGRFVVFQSQAGNLVEDEDINLLWDVFLYDVETGTIVRISGDADGVWMEPSVGPSINAGGSVVAFSSRHPTGAADRKNDFDLFVAAAER